MCAECGDTYYSSFQLPAKFHPLMNGNWLPQWGTAPTAPSSNSEAETSETLAQFPPPQPESQALGKPSKTDSKATAGPETLNQRLAEDPQNAAKVKFATIKHKSSTSSLASMSTGNWLSWAPKSRSMSGYAAANEENGDETKNRDRRKSKLAHVSGSAGQNGGISHDGSSTLGGGGSEDNNNNNNNNDDDDDDDDDDLPEDNGDEIDDHVSGEKSRKKLWSFWNGAEEQGKKERIVERATGFTNTILKSTPSLPSKEDVRESRNGREEAAASKLDAENGDSDTGDNEDAVLYKPHDSATQFSKINTHKNENLRENLIVPDWNTCLHHQRLDTSSSTSQNVGMLGAINRNQSFDIKNWRNYLSHLSSRFGFGSSLQNSDSTDPDQSTNSAVEKEFNLLYERSYRLYGRSLTRLPHYKRACLPNFNLFYTKNVAGNLKRQKTQLEEDAEDENSISITNDAMGNLLINHRNKAASGPDLNQSDIVKQSSGPLVKIKKILIVGVHGFFPTRMIRPLIGAPKGTSLKFANEAEKAVIRYCVENDLIDQRETHNVSIQKIALEKEGKIFDRVDFFLDIMTRWADELNDADFIFIAAHSQGCVVSIILFAKLIQMGILKDPLKKRIGLLGMAGVNNGPFYGVDKSFFMKAYSAIEHDSLMELFELTKFDSAQSLAYKESMQIIVNANVKLCFIGSINDQLVPLYSALASHIFHPNIYRACYIDHSSRTPDFIGKLVSVCCLLQNLGYFDNNVIKELSGVLAGPLTGGGHSKIYNDGKVYDLGLQFALDTDDLVIPPELSLLAGEDVQIPATNQIYIKEYNIGKIGTNPFVLPWCLRGLIFNIEKNWPQVEPHIMIDHNAAQRSGSEEIGALYELFDKWKPDTKLLKELKFRLNGIRASKL